MWFRGRDREIDEEIAAHLRMAVADRMARGEPREEAEAAARRELGNPTRVKEETRAVWVARWLEALVQDVRYALRTMRQAPGFTAVAVVSLALGIGANTAVFTVVRSVLLNRLPVPDPERLVVLRWAADGLKDVSGFGTSNSRDERTHRQYSNTFPAFVYRRLRDAAAGQAEVFAFANLGRVSVATGSGARLGAGLLVSGNWFAGMGVRMARGRPLLESDDRAGAPLACVVSYSFWRDVLGADPRAVEAGIRVNGVPCSVVGVAPAGFYGISTGGWIPPTDVYVPLSAQALVAPSWFAGTRSDESHLFWLQAMARLAPGTGEEQLHARLTSAFRNALAASGAPGLMRPEKPDIAVRPGGGGLDSLRRTMKGPLRVLSATAGIVLLIACANLAGLLLSRGVARRRETATRLALGASRARVVRQLVTESLLLALCGAAAGVLLARWGTRALVGLFTESWDAAAVRTDPDPLVLLATAALALLTGALFGLAPAVSLTRKDIAPGLGVRVVEGGARRRFGLGRGLLVVQSALSLVLLAGAGLFLRTLVQLRSIDPGFEQDKLLVFRMDPRLNGYGPERTRALYEEVLAAVAATPGVQAVTLMANAPLSGWMSNMYVRAEGDTGREQSAYTNRVGPGLFDTLGVRILAGRALEQRDMHSSAEPEVVLNEAAVRRFFGEGMPLGRRLVNTQAGSAFRVVGVARDIKYDSLRGDAPPTIYLPYTATASGPGPMYFVVRTAEPQQRVAGFIRAAAAAVAKDVPLTDWRTQRALTDQQLQRERLFAGLLAFFGGFALLLAAVGLHGAAAYAATRRTAEIGLRVALGASRGSIVWLILRQSVTVLAVGLAIGLGASMALSRFVASYLYGVEPLDAVSLAGAAAVLAGVSVLAAWWPAWRAARLDPAAALRAD